jgi:crotonobetainyl-CoA:carnitine CoA-transferase CaiB-like acyl-CoA transferase
VGGNVHVLLEHSNRGKKSLALNLDSEEGLDVLYRLAATCDVFLTNKLPSVRSKLKIDVEHLRAHNPRIIYVRGTGHGERGPDANRGSYDSLAYWCRAGIALSMKHADDPHVPGPPGPAFGDSIGAMTIAGGIMGALFHRERTGEATVVDVSLLGIGLWSHGASVALSMQRQVPWVPFPRTFAIPNPLVGNYRTKDDRFLSICCLQAAKYWAGITETIGQPQLASDERFADAASLMKNAAAARELLAAAFAERTAAEWRERLADFNGQWSMVQDTLEASVDPQTVANGYVVDCQTAAGTPFKLIAAPIQYDEKPAIPGRAPEFNEHGDAILGELGLDWDAIVELKARGAVA